MFNLQISDNEDIKDNNTFFAVSYTAASILPDREWGLG